MKQKNALTCMLCSNGGNALVPIHRHCTHMCRMGMWRSALYWPSISIVVMTLIGFCLIDVAFDTP